MRLRERGGLIAQDELLAVWDTLPTVDVQEILGVWRGFAFATGHPVEELLVRSRWYGKRFTSAHDVQPLICRGPDGRLFSDVTSGRGEASLWNVEFRGQVTAAMVYDGQAAIDHFKQVDASTLMGVMNGKAPWVLVDGQHFWFGLERTTGPTTGPGAADSAADGPVSNSVITSGLTKDDRDRNEDR